METTVAFSELTDAEVVSYTKYLIRQHALDIEWATFFEMFEDWYDGKTELSDNDAARVYHKMSNAFVEVIFDGD